MIDQTNLAAIMKLPEGRALMWELITFCGTEDPAAFEGSAENNVRIGMRYVGQQVLKGIRRLGGNGEVSTDAGLKLEFTMRREALAREKHEQEKVAKANQKYESTF